MKLILLADIHSNIEALNACLEDGFARGGERVVVLGDLVGYGPDPVAVIERIQGLGGQLWAAVQGNHDAAVVYGDAEMNEDAARAIEWTRSLLDASHLAFLRSLALVEVTGDATWVHASADRPEGFFYITSPIEARMSLDAAKTSYVFCGHVHDPMLYYTGSDGRFAPFIPTPGVVIPVFPYRRWLGIVGSCGQPRDGLTGAWYALFDTARAQLTYYRTQYNAAETARKIRAAGLPERFALQVEGWL
ncbi:MAG: metallophosphoesterase [Betaproteobacteria bacterium]|nr:metallophosphoesterase [Betaproteobacteria bacterium]